MREIVEDVPLRFIRENKVAADCQCCTGNQREDHGDMCDFSKSVKCWCSQASINEEGIMMTYCQVLN